MKRERDKFTSANWPPSEPTPEWVRRVEWLWTQDDANPREDTIDRAWRKLFPDDVKRPPDGRDPRWIARFDGGDADFLLDTSGVVVLWSYPGNCAIGRLRGPGASISDR